MVIKNHFFVPDFSYVCETMKKKGHAFRNIGKTKKNYIPDCKISLASFHCSDILILNWLDPVLLFCNVGPCFQNWNTSHRILNFLKFLEDKKQNDIVCTHSLSSGQPILLPKGHFRDMQAK